MTMKMKYDENYDAEIAKVDEVHLGFEDHGVYTVHLGFNKGSMHHGTGHLMLTHKPPGSEDHVVNPRVAEFIVRTMQCLGDWDKIKGTECLVLYPKDKAYHERIAGIAPLPTRKGRPFIFDEVLNR